MRTRLMISNVETRIVPEGEPVEVVNAHHTLLGVSAAAADRAAAIEREMVSPIIVRRVMPYSYEQRQDPTFVPDIEELWLYLPHEVGDKLRMVYEVWNEVFSERDKALDEVGRLRVRVEQMHESSWWRRLLRKWK